MARKHILTSRKALPLTVSGLALLLPAAVYAQAKEAPKDAASITAPPAVSAAPAGPKRAITFTVQRAGSYTLFLPGQPTGPGQFSSGDKPSTTVDIVAGATEADVIDQTAGTVAVLPISSLKNGAKVNISPADFKYVGEVQVTITASGKPVAAGSVTLTGADSKARSLLLAPTDSGVVHFKNVPVGKATVTVASSADGPKATQETVIAPTKGGGPVDVPVSLAGNVQTLDKPIAAPAGAATASGAAAPALAEPQANNWIPGVVGLILMAVGIVYAIRYLKTRGVTVEDALKKMGVEMPQDGAGGTLAAPLKPAPAPLPPLPSLTDLPAAGPASNGVATSFGTAATATAGGTAVKTAPRLVGLGGAVSGEQFPLEAGVPFSVGRDDANSLALTQDKGVSRRHARIERSGEGWALVDEGSSNGTFVNGVKVNGTQKLAAGDEIQIGSARFRFEG